MTDNMNSNCKAQVDDMEPVVGVSWWMLRTDKARE